jgi:hypothetical protein
MPKEIVLWPFLAKNCDDAHTYMRRRQYKFGGTPANIDFGAYAGPNKAVCWSDLMPGNHRDFFSGLTQNDTISLCGHCSPGLNFIASPNKEEKARPIDIVKMLERNGYEYHSQICVRACNTGVSPNLRQRRDIIRNQRITGDKKKDNVVQLPLSFVRQLRKCLVAQSKGAYDGNVLGSRWTIVNGRWPAPGPPDFITV